MFIEKNFIENDERARTRAKAMLSTNGNFTVEDNPDIYGIDLFVQDHRTNTKFFVECEVKNLWKGDKFPWTEINALTRKEKFYKQHPNSLLFLFNSSLAKCFIIKADVILNCPKVEVPNRRHSSGEYFFKIPVEQARLVSTI